MLSIGSNSAALTASQALYAAQRDIAVSMERLATGKRINSAADDAAGVAIASRLTSEIRGTNQAIRNAMDGQALIDTAEGAHKEVENILQRMRELAVQASNDTNNATDRTNLQSEMSQLTTEIDRIAQTTAWAGATLMDGKAAGKATTFTDTADFTLQVGSGTSSSDTITASIGAVTAGALGVGGATSRASVANVTATTAGSGTASAMDATTGKITLASTWAAADTLALNVNGTAHTVTVSASDKYEVSIKGIAQQVADEINALGLTGVTVTADDTGVTFSAGAAVSRPVVTNTVTAAAASGTIAGGSGTVTFGGDFNNADEYAQTVNGVTTTVTASNADQYEDNSKGIAAHMAADLETLMQAADTAVAAGSITAAQLKMAGLSVVDNADSTITIAQDANVTLTSAVTISGNSNTIANATNTITLTSVGASAAADKYTVSINGEQVTYTSSASDGFTVGTVTGHAAGLAAKISANADLKAAGYSATSSAGVVTIARAALAAPVGTTTATGGIATLSEGTGATAGTFTVGGNIDSGDVFSMIIDGKTVTATIATTDGFADTPNGAANQIAQAITTADLDGVKATYNSNTATFTLEKSGSLSLASTAAAQLSVEFIDAAIQKVNSQRADLGSISNRLDSTVSNLTNISSNLSAGRGRIEDADFAAETTNLAKTQILQQASTAMLAQANASKQGVLSLLQG